MQSRVSIADAQGDLSGADIARKIAPFVVLIMLVLGGIYGGLFTPTEAGAVGALRRLGHCTYQTQAKP